MMKNKFTRRFVALALAIVTFTTLLGPMTVHADENYYYGGQEIAWQNFTVYSTSSFTNSIGTIYQYEGFTVLLQEAPSGYLWVEYSTSTGPKRGYISIPQDEWPPRTDGLGYVTTTSTVYYGRTDETGSYGTYKTAGTVYPGEVVTIIAKNDNWAYIEYNTTSGRKRGYMAYSNLSIYNRPNYFNDFYTYNSSGTQEYISGRQYVYSGPTSLYTQVGYVENEYVTRFGYRTVLDANNNTHLSKYIEYESGGQTKSGFIVFGP